MPVTKEDVLEYWGRKFCGKDEHGKSVWKTEQFKSEMTKKKMKVAQSNNPQDFIDFANYLIKIKKLHPFEYPEQLKDLPPLKELQGEHIGHQTHSLWKLCEEKVLREYTPKTDTMVLCSCSNLKPYIDNPNYGFLLNRQKEKYCDVFINAVMLWPIENTNWLYARVYDALECSDDPKYNEASISTKVERAIHYIEKFKYKKVISWQKPDYVHTTFSERLKKYCDKNNVEFYEILDDEMMDLLVKKFKNKGLVNLRHWYQPELQHKFDLIINYPNPVPLKTEEEIRREAIIRKEKKEKRKLLLRNKQ